MKTSNWISDLCNENKHVETPESWVWWSLLTCISAAAGSNYYITTLKGDLVYYPNLYVMLLGESGLGKAYPINLAYRLVQEAGVTRVIKGRSSIQAIVQELSRTKTIEGKPVLTDSRGFIVNGELSTAIISDPDSLTILTDLYDFHSEWVNLLKGDGAEKLKNTSTTALFGSSPAHFYDSIPQVNIEGGYIGRNLIIYEEKRARDVDLLDAESKEEESTNQKFINYIAPTYVPHLKNIASKQGRLVPSEEARKVYNSWRREWRSKQISDKTGFLNRVPDHVMKVAICLTLSYYDFNPVIEASDMQLSIDKVTGLIYSNKRTVEGRGPDPLSAGTKLVIDFLLAAPENQLSRKTLLWKGYGTINTFSLEQIIDNLLEMGWVRRTKTANNQDWIVHLAGEPLASYKKFIEERKNKK